MNGLLSMIGMQTELEYQMGDDFPFGVPRIRFNVPNGNIPSDKQKCQPKERYEDYAWLLFQLEKDTEVFNLTHNTRDWTFEDWREFYLKKAKEDKQ